MIHTLLLDSFGAMADLAEVRKTINAQLDVPFASQGVEAAKEYAEAQFLADQIATEARQEAELQKMLEGH